jgi:cytochrome d ubiquinol oxidase subunit II
MTPDGMLLDGMTLETVLPVLWFGVIGFGVLMYVVLDGFVLGLGILAPFAHDEYQLDHMMNTAAPIWDGNETWLVLGGAGLLAAFPKAYALVLSTLYLPVLMMLIALIFRGVAFEFRFKATRGKPFWGAAFSLGSMVAAFAQGVILGAIVQGIPHAGSPLLPAALSWFSPFSMLTGIAVLFGYALLGAGWLVLKTTGPLQQVARGLTRPLVLVVVAFMGLVSAWLPFLDSRIMDRWFEGGHFWWLAPVPLLALANAVLLWRAAMAEGRDAHPFMYTLSFFVLGFIGLVLGIWPNIVPPDLGIWEAASPVSSQVFLGVGLALLLPAILGYTWWSYRVFRGKVEAGDGYH